MHFYVQCKDQTIRAIRGQKDKAIPQGCDPEALRTSSMSGDVSVENVAHVNEELVSTENVGRVPCSEVSREASDPAPPSTLWS